MKQLTYLLTLVLLSSGLFAQNETYNLDEVYTVPANGIIKLTTDDADIKITGSERKDVHLKVFRQVQQKGISWGNQEFEVKVHSTPNGLIISDRIEGSGVNIIGYMREEYKIEILVPMDISLKIKGDDDDYQISNINGKIRLDMDDGDAILKNCNGDDFDFDFDDGSISMDKARGAFRAQADDGDIEIRNAHLSQIITSMDDGDITIETSLDNNGEYDIRTNDATVSLSITHGGGKFYILHDDGRVSTSDDFDIVQKGEDETRLNRVGGEAVVKIRVDDGRVKLASN